jgi:hypothetical protein
MARRMQSCVIMRRHSVVVIVAVVAAFMAYAYRCRAVAGAAPAGSSYAPHASMLVTSHGKLEVSSYGFALVDDTADPILTVHVRATVDATAGSWSVDVPSASLAIEGQRPVHPLAVNADTTLPVLIASRGERRTVDFYFALPSTIFDETDLPVFDFTWLGAHTTFVRSPAAGVAIDATAGRFHRWWFDPSFPWPFFHHVDGVITRRVPTAATVGWLHGDQDDPDVDQDLW